MPRYARFYSTTEAEATSSLPQLFYQQTDAPRFTSDDAEQLDGLLNGNLAGPSRPRNDTNQPLFCPKKGVDELFSGVSGFRITNEIVHRDRFVHHDTTSEGSTEEWKIRSHTPSSDEPSPRRLRIATPTLSVRATTSSDGSDGDMAHLPKRAHKNHFQSWGSFSDHYATCPDNVLQNMDTQFSEWSYDLNEGTTGVPFVMAEAPPDTHESLVKVDRIFWVTGDEDTGGKTRDSHGAARAVLERAQKKSFKLSIMSKSTGAPKLKTSTAANAASNEDSASKRAARIAKSKAAKDSSLVVSKSAIQRRSAMQRNKNRRAVMPSPPPTARKAEPVKKRDTRTEESRPTILIVDRKDDDQRHELDSALQHGTLDFSNDKHMELLMKRLRSTGADDEEDGGRVIGEVEDKEAERKGAKEGEE
ncbi:hypothetical protein E8E12_000803 [Didymella heteroderae]|uniref:Uncharacterized protein n=1 Tax=Didymella heteroderae TaxID=1769908 RepID=A0A9P4WTG3_9PLEO|nr:hypothetical protein E8E12_000803 [Didymella heteroderae]